MADFPAFPTPEPQPQRTATLEEPESRVRVRFAPCPNGLLHVGNARTALFNWLFARSQEGQFILRMEEPDPDRTALEIEAHIMQDIAWLGLDWDEGPDRGGPAGPYRQGERLAIYRAQAETLLADGTAYPCFCSDKVLAADRSAAKAQGLPYRYAGHCRSLPRPTAERRRAAGERHAIRFRTPPSKVFIHDRLRGAIAFDGADFGDFVLVRSDGVAANNFAVVIDDALMGITHVIRGDDHLPNTPKQALLFDALGFPRPDFTHLPPVLGSDERPLVKRDRTATLAGLRADGILPAALVSYLSTLGWGREPDDGLLDLERLCSEFTLAHLSHHPAHHDGARLRHFQKLHLHHLPQDDLVRLVLPYLQQAELVSVPATPAEEMRLRTIIAALHEEIHHLPEVTEQFAYLYRRPTPTTALVSDPGAAARAVEAVAAALTGLTELDVEGAGAVLHRACAASDLEGRALFLPVRVALTGRDRGPALDVILHLLGAEEGRGRLRDFAAALHGG
ncbi:MAG: glutamate--tRNA ligase [Nitrospirota bacterium]|jgi:glutamyl-tRNA synthetase